MQQLLSFPANTDSTNSQVTPLSAPSSSNAIINACYPYALHPSGIPHAPQENLQRPLPRPLEQFSFLASKPLQTPGNYNHRQIAPSTYGNHQHINQHATPGRLSHLWPFRFRNQLSFWNPRAIHSARLSFSSFQAVPPGKPLPDKPPIKESQHSYFLAQIKGNIKKCNGCDKQFSESAAEAIDLLFTIGKKESDVYPFLHPDGQKSWRYGSETNKYYHLIVSCLSWRHPNFSLSHITPPHLDVNLSTYSQQLQERIKDTFLRRFNINLSQKFSTP